MSRPQQVELLLFTTCFFAFAYFNQGGGWNQNARFAEVRAIVEEGRFAIDDYLVYQRSTEGDDLVRLPVRRAEYDYNGDHFRLCWVDMEWNLTQVGEHPMAAGTKKSAMVSACSSGDIGYVDATAEFHPNKPPGTSFLALPGYFLIYHVEKWLGIHTDGWWILDLNSWLTSVCSVGLISALGCVLFFRLAREFADGAVLPALLATFAFAFGTTFFPFSTLLFDHDLTASLLIAAFYFLRRSLPNAEGDSEADGKSAARYALLAGICAGFSVLTNYVAILAVVALGMYALLKGVGGADARAVVRSLGWRRTVAFSIGGLGPFLLLLLYSWGCYGSPLKASNDFQNPLFHDSSAFLGMFNIPTTSEQFGRMTYVASLLIYSPFRGVFWFSPVLLLGLFGLIVWLWQKTLAAEARLCLAVFFFFFFVNATFNGYHAGFSAGPRYLIPGIPFLALPLVVPFRRWPRITSALAVLSIGINLLLTATDAQNPVGVGGHVRIEGRREELSYDLIGEYAWPLFWYGNARPLLEQQLVVELEKNRVRIAKETNDPVERAAREAKLKADLRAAIERGEQSPFMLASVRGPVSVNPLGPYEGLFEYRLFPPGSLQCRWASFNIGEFIWPGSRWSLLPLLLIGGGLGAWAILLARRVPVPTSS